MDMKIVQGGDGTWSRMTITEDHRKLLRCLYVNYLHMDFRAVGPEPPSKAPYSTQIYKRMAAILGVSNTNRGLIQLRQDLESILPVVIEKGLEAIKCT